jgi:hypothetical protein
METPMSNIYNLWQKALNTVLAFNNGTSKYVFQAPLQFKYVFHFIVKCIVVLIHKYDDNVSWNSGSVKEVESWN